MMYNQEKQGIDMHLRLEKEEDGYVLDVFDCTDQKVCNLISDIEVPLDQIPHLIENLQKEVGLIIDTVL